MARRGYKLQEFIAHTSRVNCLKIGTKSSRLLLTGGEDHKVNLWEIGRPKSLLSLSGHTTPVESVTFDSAEVLSVSGASSGAIKLWDLEEAKILRTITGHRTNCTSIEFHPFGEFFASGSLDTDLKIWDIRRKGCIHTYKGHSQGIYTIRFTPDGRWVVSGGKDNVVKLWDLTAGKLLHDFKFHEGQIRCIDFHPHEFLLATGSEDRTVKFWDLETFELIGSTAPEATGVRSITFHPDGRTLFCGLEESFKVLSWEPIRYHDSVEMGWSTLEGLSIHEGKLLGCSYHQSCVGVWVADISLIAPYAVGVLPKHLESKFNVEESQAAQKLGSNMKSTMTPQTASNGFGTKEMTGGLSTNSIQGTRSNPRRIEVAHPSKELHMSSIPSSFQCSNPSRPARNAVGEVHTGSNTQVTGKLGVASVLFRSNSLKLERASDSRTEAATPEATLPGVAFSKPIHLRNPSNITEEMEHLFASDSKSFSSSNNAVVVGRSFSSRFMAPEESCETSERNQTIKSVAEKFKKILSPEPPTISSLSGTDSLHSSEGISTIRYIKGVAVQPGRTRSLVERWENREKCNSSEALADMMSENDVLPPTMNVHNQPSERDMGSPENNMIESLMQNHDEFLGVLQSRLTKLQVVRHFWERNDIKGSINAVGRLPDHAAQVQADVVSVLIEKIDIVTLDLFSCLLPLLTGLLDSKVDRFMIISLEMLLKLVKIFWSVINTTVSAFSSVGVDLHAEQRLERCNQCFIQLQKVKQILPSLIRRGGLLAKSAMELNLALQES